MLGQLIEKQQPDTTSFCYFLYFCARFNSNKKHGYIFKTIW